MAQIINTNMASLNAQRNLNTSQGALATSLQRLSSGLRINSAKDDAAGLAISSRMSSQISGLAQAARNANDGISMAQTAEGALGQISDSLQRMRELSVQAANGSNSASDRTAIQAEISQLQQEINRVATQTSFNGTNLLDGSLSNAQFQVGANANQTINATISSALGSAIGSNVLANAQYDATTNYMTQATVTTNGVFTNNFAAQTLTITGSNGLGTPTAALLAGSSANAVAAAVNAVSNTTGVTATASTTATLSGFTAGAVNMTLRGTNGTAVNISSSVSATDLSGLTAAINAQTGVTGITAVANTAAGSISLTQSQGFDIGVQNQTTSAGQFIMNGVSNTGAAGVTRALTTTAATSTSAVGGQVSFTAPGSYTVATSAAAGAGHLLNAAVTSVGSSLSAVSNIDVTTANGSIPIGANNAISVIDAALSSINSSRAQLGAMQNRFTSVVNNLQTSQENLTASRSRIQDTDFAHETAQLTRGQILQQAGTAMLAQANALPNGVMALLR